MKPRAQKVVPMLALAGFLGCLGGGLLAGCGSKEDTNKVPAVAPDAKPDVDPNKGQRLPGAATPGG